MTLAIVSPYTHLEGHYWPYTFDLLSAFSETAVHSECFASTEPRYSLEGKSGITKWHVCCPWSRWVLSPRYRAKYWGSQLDTLFRNFEFLLCLRRAQGCSGQHTHIHCIESRHRLLIKEVLHSRHATFSSLCVGEPPLNLPADRIEKYRRAFDTGRLSFIVETEPVRHAWQHLAGEHVVHIPAALPYTKHNPVPKHEARKLLSLPIGKTICLFFGTHREGKDYRVAIKAAKCSVSQPFLLFVGPLISGNDPAALLAALNYQNAECRAGMYDQSQISLLFDAVDAVILPYSNNYAKGSAVLLQACYFQKPVIATRTGHLEEFIELNKNGLLYTSGSVSGLAGCYDRLDKHTKSGTTHDAWTFTTPQTNYSWAKVLPHYRRIFGC